MAHRVGIDLVAVAQVEQALRAHGTAYLERVFTPGEVRDSSGDGPVDPSRLAARFAAKEAVLKVLRTDEGLAWTSIELRRRPPGHVELELHGRAAALAAEAELSGFSVSVTHEAGLAMAVVTAEVGASCRCSTHDLHDPPGPG